MNVKQSCSHDHSQHTKPTRRRKPMKCKITGVYMCQPKPFTKPINLEIINTYERSASGRIIFCSKEDDFLARKLSFKTVVNFKNVWREVQAPVDDIKPNVRKRKFIEGGRKNVRYDRKFLFMFLPNGEKEKYTSIKDAANVLGCTYETIERSVEKDMPVSRGKFAGCKFVWGGE